MRFERSMCHELLMITIYREVERERFEHSMCHELLIITIYRERDRKREIAQEFSLAGIFQQI